MKLASFANTAGIVAPQSMSPNIYSPLNANPFVVATVSKQKPTISYTSANNTQNNSSIMQESELNNRASL
jgi:hypothetical protein